MKLVINSMAIAPGGGELKYRVPFQPSLDRNRILTLAGLDFIDEGDVRAYNPTRLCGMLAEVRSVLARWRVTADAIEGEPVVCLVGPANAGKSALFNRLAGARALDETRWGAETAWDFRNLQSLAWRCPRRPWPGTFAKNFYPGP